MSENSTSRKDFLAGLLTAGLALAGCTTKSNPFEGLSGEGGPTGKKVKLLSVDGEIVEMDSSCLKPLPEIPPVDNDQERVGIPGKKFIMVIDLARCGAVKNCQKVCNSTHQLHGGQNWIHVYPMKEADNASPFWQPTNCMHCDAPPCVKVCPVDATFKREDGIVLIDNTRCIGCRFCMAACPYSARIFNWNKPEISEAEACKPYSCESSTPQKVGTVGKCDFCPDMSRKSKLPHCVTACPNGVYFFGDLNEDSVTNGAETFRFSELIKDKAGYRLMEELGTHPRVYYLPPVTRNFPFEKGLPAGEKVELG